MPDDETTRELWFVGPRKVEIRTGHPPVRVRNGEVKARALFSGISQGTELLLYRGEGPCPFDPSLDAPGTPPFPRRYGYCWVGEVVESRADSIRDGQRVFALRPHGDVHVLAAEQAHVLRDDVPSTVAVLAANLETALTVIWDAGVALGDHVVVIGGGIVGLLCAHLAHLAGADPVRLIEPEPKRRRAASGLGIFQVLVPDELRPQPDADVVIEATGNPACLDLAIACAGLEATIAIASFYGERKSPVSLGADFHRRRLQLRASQVSRLPPLKLARWSTARRFAKVLDYLAEPSMRSLIEPPVPFDDAPAVYARLDANPGEALQTVLSYGRAV